jgi:hypothetical protein
VHTAAASQHAGGCARDSARSFRSGASNAPPALFRGDAAPQRALLAADAGVLRSARRACAGRASSAAATDSRRDVALEMPVLLGLLKRLAAAPAAVWLLLCWAALCVARLLAQVAAGQAAPHVRAAAAEAAGNLQRSCAAAAACRAAAAQA